MKKVFVAILIVMTVFVFFKKYKTIHLKSTSQAPSPVAQQSNSPQIVSTNPDPLDNATIPASQIIEINFNIPLQNVPEFKTRMDPKIDYKVELSQDRKTAKIIPSKPYELGATYTFFISPESKFDGDGKLDGEKIFHFHTIKYTGV